MQRQNWMNKPMVSSKENGIRVRKKLWTNGVITIMRYSRSANHLRVSLFLLKGETPWIVHFYKFSNCFKTNLSFYDLCQFSPFLAILAPCWFIRKSNFLRPDREKPKIIERHYLWCAWLIVQMHGGILHSSRHPPLFLAFPLVVLLSPFGFWSLSSKYDPLTFSSFSSLFVCLPGDLWLGAVEGLSPPNSSSSSPRLSENRTECLVELGAVSGLARPPRLRDRPLEAADGM